MVVHLFQQSLPRQLVKTIRCVHVLTCQSPNRKSEFQHRMQISYKVEDREKTEVVRLANR